MGVSKNQLYALVDQSLIKPLVKHGQHNLLETWFDRGHLQKFLKKLMVLAPRQVPESHAIKFSRICQAYLGNVELLPLLLKAINSGDVNITGVDLGTSETFNLSSMYFYKDDITLFRKKYSNKLADAVTVLEATKIMKMSQQAMYYLVNNGFIKSQAVKSAKSHGRVVTFKDLAEFERTYVPLSKIAREKNTHWKSLITKISNIGLTPAIGGGVDECVKVFYLRSQVTKLINDPNF